MVRHGRNISFVRLKLLPILLACCASTFALGQTKPLRHVLIFYEVGTSYPLTNLVDAGIRKALAGSPYRIEFYREYMETVAFPDPADQKRLRDFYVQKYANHKPDIIITVGSSPLGFIAETHRTSFAGVPVVYCFPNMPLEHGPVEPSFTGVVGDIDAAATLSIALRLLPNTLHVVVVGGTTSYDRYQASLVKEQLAGYNGKLDISYLTDLTTPDLVERLRHLPNRTVVLLTAFGRDLSGVTYNADESGPLVVGASNAPVFSLVDRFMNHGEVGGALSSAAEDGALVGRMALKILKGEPPEHLPVVKTATKYIFDGRALERWELTERPLPPGSIVLNREPTVWEVYKWYILSALCLVMLQTAMISGLLVQRRRRRAAERELDIAYERLRLSVEAGRSVAWDFDVKSGQNYWFGDLQTMFAIPSQSYFGQAGDLQRRVLPEDWHTVETAIENARQSREPYSAEFRIRRDDRVIRWIAARGKFYYTSDGVPERMLGIAVDITERKNAEESLATVGRRLIEAQEQERTRIGRELHDAINQRLALLAVELDRWKQSSKRSDVHDRIEETRRRVEEIAAEVQALSHQLHSSKLEYLGLSVAARSFCKEFSEKYNVHIDFKQSNVPRILPPEVSLCLFRILQEGLQNAVKYSGADHFELELSATGHDIRLTLRDHGKGFNVFEAMKSKGLGLVSMRERVNLVNGTIAIKSNPAFGTEIIVHVPIARVEHASEVTSGAA